MTDIETERTQHNRASKTYTLLAYVFLVAIVIQLIFVGNGILSDQYTWTKYFVEYGDSLGALLASFSITLFLFQMRVSSEERLDALLESEKDRKLLLDENRLSRQIMRIKERLEFYSDLYEAFAYISQIKSTKANTLHQQIININEAFQEHEVKRRYPRYVSPDLLEYFSRYYDKIHQSSPKQMNDEQFYQAGDTVNNLIIHVIDTYADLVSEYEELIKR